MFSSDQQNESLNAWLNFLAGANIYQNLQYPNFPSYFTYPEAFNSTFLPAFQQNRNVINFHSKPSEQANQSLQMEQWKHLRNAQKSQTQQIPKKQVKQIKYSDQNSFKKQDIRKNQFKNSEQKRTQTKALIKHKKIKTFQDEDYIPQQTNQEIGKGKGSADTKNIIKNFARGMVNFISNNKGYCFQLLERLEINPEGFYKFIRVNHEKIQNIVQLRQLWLEEKTQFAKALRIISLQFYRKRYIPYTYNSKVKLTYRNLKYRHKIAEGMRKPEQFTTLKDVIIKNKKRN